MTKNYNTLTYKNREEWLKGRTVGFGGSSVSAILGKNKWMTKLDLYCASVNPSEEKKDATNPSTIYGQAVEPVLAQLFAVNYPQYIIDYPKVITMYQRKDKPYMLYTADGLLEEADTKRKGFIEFKSHEIRNSEDEMMWASGQLPEQYYIQVLQGFAVLNDKEFCELFAILNHKDYNTGLIKYSELRHYHLERKDIQEDVDYVEKQETTFEEENILKRLPPDFEITL